MISWYEFIERALSAKGTNYRYGAKMEILGEHNQQMLIKMYPKYYSGVRKQIAIQTCNEMATDCSGLLTWAAGVDIMGSTTIKENAKAIIPVSKVDERHIGWAVWRSGHIGIYIGNGKVIEARGFDYGVSIWTLKKRDFTHALKLDFVDYDAFPSDEAVFLQAICNKKGAKIEVDGIAGPKTRAAVKKYLL